MKLYTRRLEIRPFRRDDWRELKRITLDFQASQYRYFDREMPTEDERVRALTEFFESTGMCFAVFEQDGAEMLGYIGFYFENGNVDVGYCFHSSAHGKGYAFESISALMSIFEDTGMVERFTAGTALDNAPSVKLLGRLGFAQTGTEEVCFYDGYSFAGGTFEKKVNTTGNRPQP